MNTEKNKLVLKDNLDWFLHCLSNDIGFVPPLVYMSKYKDDLYGVEAYGSEIIKIQGRNGLTSSWREIDESARNSSFVGNAICVGRSLVVVPFNGKQFWAYDIENEIPIELNYELEKTTPSIGCARAYCWNNRVIMFPATGSAIYSLDIEKKEVNKIIDLRTFVKEKKGYDHDILITGDPYCYNNEVFWGLCRRGILGKMEVNSSKITLYDISDEGIIQMIGDKARIFMLTQQSKILCYDIQNNKIIEEKSLDIPQNYDLLDLQATFSYQENLYFLTPRNNWGIRINSLTMTAEVCTIEKLFSLSVRPQEDYHFTHFENDTVYFLSNMNRLTIVNLRKNESDIIDLKFV